VNTEPITIDGVAGPVVVSTNMFWGHPVVTVAGQPATRAAKRQYDLPASAGGTVPATLRTGVADPYPTVEVNGVRHRTGPKVPMVLQILALLPIALVAIGGLLGGLLGALAFAVNVLVARTRLHAALKALLMLVIGAVAFVILLVIAGAVRAATSS